MRLCLGTVQFGLSYGVANKSGQLDPGEGRALLEVARQSGIDMLDTAVAYGVSEQRLGEFGIDAWKVVTKLPAYGETTEPRAWVRAHVEGSLARLRKQRLYGLLMHRSADLLGPAGSEIAVGMAELRDRGLVGKVGVSIYDPEELDALEGVFAPELVQAPFNILDRRIVRSGWLDRLKARGAEVHTRSAFLQGLLLMNDAERPAYFARWDHLWRQWRDWLRDTGGEAVRACLGFILSHPGVDRVVVGVDGVGHLQALIAAAGNTGALPPDSLGTEDLELLNPSKWPPRKT